MELVQPSRSAMRRKARSSVSSVSWRWYESDETDCGVAASAGIAAVGSTAGGGVGPRQLAKHRPPPPPPAMRDDMAWPSSETGCSGRPGSRSRPRWCMSDSVMSAKIGDGKPAGSGTAASSSVWTAGKTGRPPSWEGPAAVLLCRLRSPSERLSVSGGLEGQQA